MEQVPIASSLTCRSAVQAILVRCQVKLASLPENIDIITNIITNIFTISITNMSVIKILARLSESRILVSLHDNISMITNISNIARST